MNTLHRTNYNNPHSVTKDKLGLNNVENIKNNYSSIRLPNPSDNESAGYSVGSRWFNLIEEKEYVCFVSKGNAVWKEIGENIIPVNIGNGICLLKNINNHRAYFKSICPKSTKINIIDGVESGTVEIDINTSNININDFIGTLSIKNGGTGRSNYPINKFLQSNGDEPFSAEKDIPIGNVVGTTDKQHITNKTINALDNSIYNLSNANIKWDANIDISKLAGSITTNEFKHLKNVKSNIQHQIDLHTHSKNNPHGVTKQQLGLENVLNIKHNLNSKTYPKVFDDSLLGYSIGSKWIDKLHQKTYVCVDPSLNNAQWVQTSNDLGVNDFGLNLGSGEGIYLDKIDTNFRFKSLKGGNNVILESTNEEIIVNSISKYSFILASVPIECYSTSYKNIVYFPWLTSEFSSFKNGKIIFRVNVINRGLTIRAFNPENNSTLGVKSNILESGSYSFPIANPSSDSMIIVQIKKLGFGGSDPRIYGLVLKFDN